MQVRHQNGKKSFICIKRCPWHGWHSGFIVAPLSETSRPWAILHRSLLPIIRVDSDTRGPAVDGTNHTSWVVIPNNQEFMIQCLGGSYNLLLPWYMSGKYMSLPLLKDDYLLAHRTSSGTCYKLGTNFNPPPFTRAIRSLLMFSTRTELSRPRTSERF